MKVYKKWQKIISKIDYAFQPIVSLDSGKTIGFEALLRDINEFGHESIDAFFDEACKDDVLGIVEVSLREKAIEKFLSFQNPSDVKLFLNVDNRIVTSKKIEKGRTKDFLEKKGVTSSFIVFEISEKHKIDSYCDFKKLFDHYAKQDFSIALDDYGTGFSGIELLYHTDPNYVKIDRFFISDIDKDLKKQLFLKKILEISHVLGHTVIAEGIETKEEFWQCKEMGFDLAQGFLIQEPTKDISKLHLKYDLEFLKSSSKRDIIGEIDVLTHLQLVPSVHYKSLFKDIFSIFKSESEYTFLVVVDDYNFPMGVIQDKSLKGYIYSPFGNELLSQKRICDKIDKFVTKASVANVNDTIDSILKVFSHNQDFSSVIINENGVYKGVLTAKMMLDIIHKKQILDARDQNPLTKLPGNSYINNYMRKCMDLDEEFFHIYFDLDNFKPYNDKYGFRNGDRIIILFADILRAFCDDNDTLIGHIGGDDFFMSVSLKKRTEKEIIKITQAIIDKFSKDVIAFYNQKDVEQGYIESQDRKGNKNRYEFLTVSAAALEIKKESKKHRGIFSDIFADIKKSAKKSPIHLSIASLL